MSVKKCHILLLVFTILVCSGCFSSTADTSKAPKSVDLSNTNNLLETQYNNWIPVESGHISFKVPPTLEKADQNHIDQLNSVLGSNQLKIMYQQNGLNEAVKSHPESANGHFARVILECIPNPDAEGMNFGDKITWSKDDLDTLFEMYKKSTEKDIYHNDYYWGAIKPVDLPCGQAINISYKRKYGNNPPANVNVYIFFDNKIIYSLTISYRSTEEHIWCTPGNDIRNIVNTIRYK
ncbi:hypothetical protein [uncultured Anaerovibrio sp.]|uniref:hypothetical protein n=1 Tax=uncultured Anaerovibrio sp. TaxID=361586 RepID=UPI0025D84B53|nr:hypothetical protein [uncultured Anaerovibrio sp.]